MFGLGGKAGDFRGGSIRRASSTSEADSSSRRRSTTATRAARRGRRFPAPSCLPAGPSVRHTVSATPTALYKVSGGFDSRVYGAGASYLFTPAVEADAGAWLTSDGNDTGNRSVLTAIGLRYFLSKATTVYGQVGVVHNHGLMNTEPRSTARCTRGAERPSGRWSAFVIRFRREPAPSRCRRGTRRRAGRARQVCAGRFRAAIRIR